MGDDNNKRVVASSFHNGSSDPSSPFFLSPSDNPGATLVSCLLKGENYPTWRRAMQNALKAKNKMKLVDGTLKKPAADDSTFEAWEKSNSMIISWIFNSLAPELHTSVAYADTATEMWTDLAERFSVGNAPRIHELKREIALLQQQGSTVVVYFTKLKALWDELSTYSAVYPCTCGAAKQLLEEREGEKLHNFLMGLNDQFSVVRSQILNMEPLPSLNKAYALVTKEEKQLSVATTRQAPAEAAAFATKTEKNWTNKTSNKALLNCTHCGKNGHTADGCFELIGYPDWWQGEKTQGQHNKAGQKPKQGKSSANQALATQPENAAGYKGIGLSQTQYDQLVALLANQNQESLVNFAGKVSTNSSHWIIDTGASDHMTCHQELLTNACSATSCSPVQMPNGANLKICSYG